MKKSVLISGGAVGLVAVSAFVVVATMGVPSGPPPPPVQAGTDAYYVGEQKVLDLPGAEVNLSGESGRRYLAVDVSIVYRCGLELADAAPVIEGKQREISDLWVMLLGSKTYAEVEGFEKKNLVKEEIRQALERTLFPDKKARIDDVLFRKFQIQ